MIRIAGVILNNNKHVSIALRQIFGIGKISALYICQKTNTAPNCKIKDLNKESISSIQKLVSKFEIEGNLRTRIKMNIKRLKDIKCYKGSRHKLSLPVNGQRTKTNAKTRKKIKKNNKKRALNEKKT